MTKQEALHKPENERGLNYWISVIEARWKQNPEFKVDPKRLAHLAVICDGNRRSAREKGLHSWQGHRLGVEAIKGIMRASNQWGIRHLTFWTWSTENWERDQDQVNFIMNLAARHLRDEESIGILIDHEAKFTHLGRKDRLPKVVREAIGDLEQRTAEFSQGYVNLALDYGGLDEMARATARIIEDAGRGLLAAADVVANQELVLQYLDTGGQPLPDLVLRTGVKPEEIPHTSGFMPLQTAYSGWAFLPDLFPDLTPNSLLGSIEEFIDYDRRFGR